MFCTVLTGALLVCSGGALHDVLPGDKFVLGSAIGNKHQARRSRAGGGVAVVDVYRTLGLDAVSFGISAFLYFFFFCFFFVLFFLFLFVLLFLLF